MALNTSVRFPSRVGFLRMLGHGPLSRHIADMLAKRLETVASPVISEVVQPDGDNLQSRLLSDVLLPESIIRLTMHLEEMNYFRACQFFETSRNASLSS